MSSVSTVAPGAKPEGSAPATPEEHVPRMGWRRDPSAEDVRRYNSHRRCPSNARFYFLAALLDVTRQTADEMLDWWTGECRCNVCDHDELYRLAQTCETMCSFLSSALEGSLLEPPYSAGGISKAAVADRLKALQSYASLLADGVYDSPVDLDPQPDEPLTVEPFTTH